MDNKQYKSFEEKLDKMSKLLAAIAIQGKSFREQIQLLSDVGLGPSEISKIVGKDVNSIKVTKSLMKKKLEKTKNE